jgi:hypothetical protein
MTRGCDGKAVSTHYYAASGQVRRAQHAGAAGVLIADYACLCDDMECKSQTGNTNCESQEPIVADDGSGGDITIPSFLVFKHDADKMKVELMNNTHIQVEKSWVLPHPDDRVEYELWTIPEDPVSLDFLLTFPLIAEALGDRAYFSPHMYLLDGIKSHCTGCSRACVPFYQCSRRLHRLTTPKSTDSMEGQWLIVPAPMLRYTVQWNSCLHSSSPECFRILLTLWVLQLLGRK